MQSLLTSKLQTRPAHQGARSGVQVGHTWCRKITAHKKLISRCSAAANQASKELESAEKSAQSAVDHLNEQLTDVDTRSKALERDGMDAGRGVQGDMLKPSPSNNNMVRALAVGGALLLAARGTGYLPARTAATVHLISWATLLGTNIWTTFFAGLTMYKNLPRQVFGRLQSKLFPLYFWLSSGCSLLAISTLYFSGTGILRPQTITLGACLAGSLANLFAVEPHTTKLMFARHKLENMENRDNARIKALYKQFGMWHGISSTLNLAVLVAAITHGWYLSASMLRLAV